MVVGDNGLEEYSGAVCKVLQAGATGRKWCSVQESRTILDCAGGRDWATAGDMG